MQNYLRPKENYRIEISILSSRFITTVACAKTTNEARTLIQNVRDEMPDASHHIYAFRVGYGNTIIEGMSDDGEPSGTAGSPSLAVVRGSDLGDIVLVTTRYFGGKKLGTGGLVRAYTESAKVALQGLQTEMKAVKAQLGMDLPYSLYEQVKLLVVEYKGVINDEVFAGEVTIIFTMVKDMLDAFNAELTELSSGQIETILLATLDD